MNYQRIHDIIIKTAHCRSPLPGIKYHKHHITPIHEGGAEDGPIVLLTIKEHWIVHKLRYKMTGSIGNILAYNFLKYGAYPVSQELRSWFSSQAAKKQHQVWKQEDPVGYRARQQKAGVAAGNNSKQKKLGFFSLSENEKKQARDKGRLTTVKNKLGMFSDEYRRTHRLNLMKPLCTPEGEFESMTTAALHFNVTPGTITYRVNSNNIRWCQWHYKGEDNE